MHMILCTVCETHFVHVVVIQVRISQVWTLNQHHTTTCPCIIIWSRDNSLVEESQEVVLSMKSESYAEEVTETDTFFA